jgi:hypothetical protein
MTDDALLTSLLAAVSAAPDDVPLRLHVAELLAAAQRVPEALPHVTHALTVQPGDTAAIALLQRLGAMLAAPVTPQPPTEFDWGQAEDQVRDVRQPAFAQDSPSAVTEDVDLAERPSLRLADVGGMEQVKQRLELSFLGPIRNPQLASAFGATAAGGLLLYGPPGCGKTFIARAVAGEIGARFSEFGVADVLDMWTGSSERNLAQSGAGDGPGAARRLAGRGSAGHRGCAGPVPRRLLDARAADAGRPALPGHRPVRAPLTFPR